ncbi:hypothetical protein GNX_0964 [Leptospira interrogans serovar Canicola]|nr:hypothetical protein GNX_0964 [Leptospira interrogans serovar Canicola]
MPGKIHTIRQNYYFFGLLPKEQNSGNKQILPGRAKICASVYFFLGRGLGTIDTYNLFSSDLGGRMLSLIKILGFSFTICFFYELPFYCDHS